MTLKNFVSDFDLVKQLEQFGITQKDAYQLIDRFDSPQPPAIQGARVFRVQDSLQLKLRDLTLQLSESNDPKTKWSLSITRKIN